MRKVIKIIGAVSIIFFSIIIFKNHSDTIKNISADYYNISYGTSYYEGIDKAEQSTTELLVNDYNKIKIIGTTNQEINYDKAICIIFVKNDQISGQVTIDNLGICQIENKPGNYIIQNKSIIYEDSIKAYDELKEKFN